MVWSRTAAASLLSDASRSAVSRGTNVEGSPARAEAGDWHAPDDGRLGADPAAATPAQGGRQGRGKGTHLKQFLAR
jgi:hypothetical protein